MDDCYSKLPEATRAMVLVPPIPPIIGADFQHKVGQTNFRKAQHFTYVDKERVLSERKLPPTNQPALIQPPLYAQNEVSLLPAWMAFNKETLVFDAYFKEALQEYQNSPYLPRFVKIYFFLEDGTIQVVEPRTNNSGLHQGIFIKRQRIRLPDRARTDEFVDVIDLNIGQEVEFFGRVFKITNCDRFTRNFLNRNGISVPDPIKSPEDPYLKNREMSQLANLPKKPKKPADDIRQFLKFDRCVLRFYGYWDDRDNLDGELHKIVLMYYLADDTIEVKEQLSENSGKKTSPLLCRQRLPMEVKVPGPGQYDTHTVLNVLSEDNMGVRIIYDPLNCGGKIPRFYSPTDLAIGGVVNVMGRKVVLCDCDKYTQEYYRRNYGLDSFEPIPYPDDGKGHTMKSREPPPPYNGFGSYEDSLSNCLSVVPKKVNKNFKQMLAEGREGYDSHILRFGAKMITKNNRTAHRKFVILCYLSDDTMSVFEDLSYLKSEGPSGQKFFSRDYFVKPGEEKYGCRKPAMYTREDCYVGATLILNEFTFQLVEADEYTLRFMELNALRFPKSNINFIMNKIRQCAKPVYRQFVSDSFGSSLECGVVPFCKFRKALIELMGEELVEHEILTVARKFRIKLEPGLDEWTVRHRIHCHFKKLIYVVDKASLAAYFKHFDVDHTGRLPKQVILRCLKGAHIPLSETDMEDMLKCIKPGEDGNLPYMDVLDFMDFLSPVPCPPYGETSWMSEMEDRRIIVDINAFLQELGLEGSGNEAPKEC